MSELPTVLDTRVVTGVGGGPDKTILNSPRFLAHYGYRMLCAYMHPPADPGFEELRQKAAARQAPLLSVPDRGPVDWRVVRQLLEICRQERVWMWHGHDYKSNALGLLLRRFWPMRLVSTVHGWGKTGPRTPLYYAIDRFCLARYESVLCASSSLHQRCLAYGVPPRRCLLLENGIDTEEYARRLPVALAKKRLGFPPERLLIGAVGRLSEEKGFPGLIRAADQLLRTGFDLSLLIVGGGAQERALRHLIAGLGRADRIHLLGYRSEVRDIYEALDVYVLNSLREGLPNVLLEAMAYEVPVVATRIAGVPRLIEDGTNGLLLEPGDGAALAAALTRLLRDVPLRTRLGQAGRQTVESRYSFAVRMQKLATHYDALRRREQRARAEPKLPASALASVP